MEFYDNLKFGILGGGQLGRMLLQASFDLNLQPSVLDPDPDAPCAPFAPVFTVGSLTDFDTVYNFGKGMDLLTLEIENVNVEALERLEQEGVKIYPQPKVVKIIQDKRLQKQFFRQHSIPTSEFVLLDDKNDIFQHPAFLPAFQKLGKAGYDGKGVRKIGDVSEIEKGFSQESILEKMVDYEKELSVIVARNPSGQVVTYPVAEMVFHPQHNLVEYLFSPASINQAHEKEAKEIAVKIIESLDMCGILAVELFLTKTGDILVNEVAPRPHNSGHHTIKGNFTSQFEQHLRAILNIPLGSTRQHRPAAMVNLLGEPGFLGEAHYEGISEALDKSGIYVYLYGKKLTKPFRKMGHITLLADTVEALHIKANYVRQILKVKS